LLQHARYRRAGLDARRGVPVAYCVKRRGGFIEFVGERVQRVVKRRYGGL
jgi:hypothetical protein